MTSNDDRPTIHVEGHMPGIGKVEADVDPHSPEGRLLTAQTPPVSIVSEDDVPPIAHTMLSKADRDVLRRLSGNLTLAEWMARPGGRPWRVTDRRVLLVAAARVKATQDAQLLARLCPDLLIRPVATDATA